MHNHQNTEWESSDLERTFVLLVLRELPLQSPIDHVREAVLVGSARRVRLGAGGIAPLHHRVRLGELSHQRASRPRSEAEKKITEQEQHENRRGSHPHCRGSERPIEPLVRRLAHRRLIMRPLSLCDTHTDCLQRKREGKFL